MAVFTSQGFSGQGGLPIAIGVLTGGGIILYAGIKGESIGTVLSNALSQKNPGKAIGESATVGGAFGKGDPGSSSSTGGSGGSAPYTGKGEILELIHTPLGHGIKDGKRVSNDVYAAVLAGHYNHVHVAARPGKARPPEGFLGHLENMAVHHFGLQITATTNGVHVPGSYHYRNMAFDAGGSKDRMMAFARYVDGFAK